VNESGACFLVTPSSYRRSSLLDSEGPLAVVVGVLAQLNLRGVSDFFEVPEQRVVD